MPDSAYAFGNRTRAPHVHVHVHVKSRKRTKKTQASKKTSKLGCACLGTFVFRITSLLEKTLQVKSNSIGQNIGVKNSYIDSISYIDAR